MKRYKDLSGAQKKAALNHMYKRCMNSIHWNGAGTPPKAQQRLKEIRERIKFCGCMDCEIKLNTEIQKDSVIKEYVLEQAQLGAEAAYYPEDDDTIIKV